MYKKINFAKVVDINDVDNPEALEKRKIYIEQQLSKGFSEKVISYQKDNEHNYWSNLVSQSQKLIEITRDLYKKHQQSGSIIFQLEQVLGRAEYLFEKRENVTQESNSQYYLDYQDNLKHIELLSTQLSGHQSIMMKHFGIALMAMATLIAVTTLFASVLAFGGVFITGAAVLGLILTGSGLLALYKQQQKGLSLAASALVITANQVQSTLDYFDKSVSPNLYAEDSLALRETLILQLNKGFAPIIIKNALEWANRANYITNEGYERFFDCMADICCESSDYWINYIREQKKCWPDSHEHFFNQVNQPKHAKDKFFIFFAKSTSSAASILKLIDDIPCEILHSEDKITLKEGLQRLINKGVQPSLLKNALAWAKARYDDAQVLVPLRFGEEGKYFERLVVICGVERLPKLLELVPKLSLNYA